MSIVVAVLLCILLGYFWIWLVQYLFVKEKKLFSWKLFGTSVFLVLALYCFSYVMQQFFPSIEGFSLSRFGYFLLYVALIFVFLIFFTFNYKTKQLWFLFVVWLLLFAVVGFFGFKIGLESVVLFYLVSAYAEEFLKIGATENATTITNFYSSDVLFFSLFVGLGFSIVENVLYIIQSFFGEGGGMFSLIFGRGIFSSLLHLITTGLVALLLYTLYQHISLKNLSLLKKIIRVMVCLLAGVVLHVGYNIASEYSQIWIYVLLVIGGYFLLTYLLFLSDQLYSSDW